MTDNSPQKDPSYETIKNPPKNINSEIVPSKSLDSSEITSQKVPVDVNLLQTPIDPRKNRFPYCIVWTPLPLITWLFPFIGHVGICTSEGVIHDFSGPYYVSVDEMAFGNPTKYALLKLSERERKQYDLAIDSGTNHYNSREYSLCCNNCHSYVADCLNKMKYKDRNNYNMISVWWMILVNGKYISCGGWFKSYIGFIVVLFIAFVLWYISRK